jgi:CheY-like chemotaxis protein
MAEARIRVADDEAITRDNVSYILQKEGYAVSVAENGSQAVGLLQKEEFDLILTDLRMPDMDGLAVLAEARRLRPEVEVIVLTGYATVATAVEAMQKGAYSYLAKPYKIEELRLLVARALERRMLAGEVRELRRKVVQTSGVSRFIGQTPKILALKETIVQVAQLDCNVLILGETGTGKELVARIIHELSPRGHQALHGRQLRRLHRGAHDQRALRLRARAFTARPSPRPGSSRPPAAAPCSSTRSASCPRACRSSSCASCRRRPSCAWAAPPKSRPTSASWPPPTRT